MATYKKRRYLGTASNYRYEFKIFHLIDNASDVTPTVLPFIIKDFTQFWDKGSDVFALSVTGVKTEVIVDKNATIDGFKLLNHPDPNDDGTYSSYDWTIEFGFRGSQNYVDKNIYCCLYDKANTKYYYYTLRTDILELRANTDDKYVAKLTFDVGEGLLGNTENETTGGSGGIIRFSLNGLIYGVISGIHYAPYSLLLNGLYQTASITYGAKTWTLYDDFPSYGGASGTSQGDISSAVSVSEDVFSMNKDKLLETYADLIIFLQKAFICRIYTTGANGAAGSEVLGIRISQMDHNYANSTTFPSEIMLETLELGTYSDKYGITLIRTTDDYRSISEKVTGGFNALYEIYSGVYRSKNQTVESLETIDTVFHTYTEVGTLLPSNPFTVNSNGNIFYDSGSTDYIKHIVSSVSGFDPTIDPLGYFNLSTSPTNLKEKYYTNVDHLGFFYRRLMMHPNYKIKFKTNTDFSNLIDFGTVYKATIFGQPYQLYPEKIYRSGTSFIDELEFRALPYFS